MGPELIDPQRFGFENSRPTKSSDCYALGMVIYETVSGNLPFHEHSDLTVVMKVLAGERPPRGAGFAEELWKTLEQCWVPQPNNRPSIEDVLQCLEMVSGLLEPHSLGEETEEDGENWLSRREYSLRHSSPSTSGFSSSNYSSPNPTNHHHHSNHQNHTSMNTHANYNEPVQPDYYHQRITWVNPYNYYMPFQEQQCCTP
jgi:hypothetical protein